MIKKYLAILMITGLIVGCSSLQNPRTFSEPTNQELETLGRNKPPKPVVVDEEIVVILPCYNSRKPSLYSYSGNEINPTALKRMIEDQRPSVGRIEVVDFYGTPRTVDPESRIENKARALCLIAFDVRSKEIATVVNDFQEALCLIFGLTTCNASKLKNRSIVVGPNIAYASSGQRSNDPTCDKGTMNDLDDASKISKDINVSKLRNFLQINSTSSRGAGIDIAILDTGGSYDDSASRNLTTPHWPVPNIDRSAESDVRDNYKCGIPGALDKHGAIVSRIIDVLVPNANRIMFKVCKGNGDCEGVDIFKAFIYAHNGFTNAPDVVNMSFGTTEIPLSISPTGEDRALKFLLKKAERAMSDTLFMASSGNGGSLENTHYPATYQEDFPNVLAVGASRLPDSAVTPFNVSQLEKAGFSSQVTDYLAPGVNLKVEGRTSRTRDGTSFAAPAVTALAALYMEEHPNASPETVRDNLKAGAVTNPIGQHLFVYVP